MRLVLIGPTYPFRGGISHYFTMLCNELRKSHQVDFFSYIRQYPRWLYPGQTDLDPSAMPLQATAYRTLDPLNPLTWVQTLHRIRSAPFDGIIFPWVQAYWAPMFGFLAFWIRRLTPTRVIFICFNPLPKAHERHLFDSSMAWLVLSQGDGFIVHAETDKVQLGHLVPGARVLHVAQPIFNVFPSRLDSATAKAQLGLKGPVALFFGFVRPYKGLGTLLQAMPLALERIPLHLLIVGEFWEEKAGYERMIAEYRLTEHVTVIGRYVPNEELGLYFGAADVVVLPYESATQSGVVQTAYGYEKPVICTRVGGLPEVVFDGETGFLVPPGDAAALADAMVHFFVENLGDTFAGHIRRLAPVAFGWEGLVHQIEALIAGEKPGVSSQIRKHQAA
jgi:glycosyltransferase involved in cell wall biosynthesis